MTLVSLSKARKARAKAADKAQAAENRVAFGRTKAEKARAQADASRTARHLDGKRLEP
ncbi:DUF4169 family protein [Phenylobacterium parvum]|uniref:DUF4169 family protein n=1 Tax=Phenylobacterium parvum TaxID=2201350 RepID=UPI0018EF6C29|nr:DUF4169 family protein [Phenylobacterium parvum]